MIRREAIRRGSMIGLRNGRRLRVLAKMMMLDLLHNVQEGIQQGNMCFWISGIYDEKSVNVDEQ